MAALACLGASLAHGQSTQVNRISDVPELSRSVRVAGHVPRWAATATDQGPVPDATPLNLTLVLTRAPEQQAAFEQLLRDQQDPNSAEYHRWLTPAEVGERFGPTPHDLDALAEWARTSGLGAAEVAPSRVFVNLHTTAGAASTALATGVHSFSLADGSHHAAVANPALPAAFAGLVQSVEGLTEGLEQSSAHMLPAPAETPAPRTAGPKYTYLSSYHYIEPADFATIFDLKSAYTAGFLGTGQRIAVVGRSRVANTDISTFEYEAGWQTNLPNVVLPDSSADPGYAANADQGEATLDVSRALGTAPLAQVDLVVVSSSAGGIGPATQYAVNTLNDPVLSISFSSCESAGASNTVNFWDTLFAQAAAQGISVFVGSGDSGVAACDADYAAAPATQVASVNAICSSSHATCVGGTELIDESGGYWNSYNDLGNESAIGYIPEGAWNDPVNVGSSTLPYVVLATGGGSSAFIGKPAWQSGTGVPADGARDVPDLSFPASGHNGYYTCYAAGGGDCSQSRFMLFFGTSAASPSMAAIAALLNQRTGVRQGNLNPLLYRLAANPANAVFHDVTVASSGVGSCNAATPSVCNNSTPGPGSLTGGLAGYAVTPGFDLATGWGSLDAGNLLATVGGVQAATALNLSINPGTALVNTPVTITAKVSSQTAGTPGGYVQLYLNGSAYGDALSVTGGTATLTKVFTIDVTGALSAYYSGDAVFAPSQTTSTPYLNVHHLYPTATVTPQNPTISVLSSQNFTVTVIGTGPTPTGTVQMNVTNSSGPTVNTFTLSNGSATGTPGTMAPGVWRQIFTYSGDSNYQGTSVSNLITVNGLPYALTLAASTTSINPTQTVDFTAQLSSQSGTPSGTVQLYVDSSPSGSAMPVNGSGSYSFPAIPLSLGSHSVHVLYSGDALFGTSSSNSVSIVNSGFSITPSLSSLGVLLSSPTSTTISLTYASGGGFNGAITQSCTITRASLSQPDYTPQCSFSPGTVNLSPNATATSVLSFSASAPRAVLVQHMAGLKPGRPGRTAVAELTSGLWFGAVLFAGRKRRLRPVLFRMLLLGSSAVWTVAALSGCGSGTSTTGATGSQQQSSTAEYKVVVTGTSGSLVIASQAIQLFIN